MDSDWGKLNTKNVQDTATTRWQIGSSKIQLDFQDSLVRLASQCKARPPGCHGWLVLQIQVKLHCHKLDMITTQIQFTVFPQRSQTWKFCRKSGFLSVHLALMPWEKVWNEGLDQTWLISHAWNRSWPATPLQLVQAPYVKSMLTDSEGGKEYGIMLHWTAIVLMVIVFLWCCRTDLCLILAFELTDLNNA